MEDGVLSLLLLLSDIGGVTDVDVVEVGVDNDI